MAIYKKMNYKDFIIIGCTIMFILFNIVSGQLLPTSILYKDERLLWIYISAFMILHIIIIIFSTKIWNKVFLIYWIFVFFYEFIALMYSFDLRYSWGAGVWNLIFKMLGPLGRLLTSTFRTLPHLGYMNIYFPYSYGMPYTFFIVRLLSLIFILIYFIKIKKEKRIQKASQG